MPPPLPPPLLPAVAVLGAPVALGTALIAWLGAPLRAAACVGGAGGGTARVGCGGVVGGCHGVRWPVRLLVSEAAVRAAGGAIDGAAEAEYARDDATGGVGLGCEGPSLPW